MSQKPLAIFGFFAALMLVMPKAAQASGLRVFRDSIRTDAAREAAGTHLMRHDLSSVELTEPIVFSVSLRMRDLTGLQARLESGEKISQAEMEARYLPLRSDYDRVSAWLEGQGFTSVLPDSNHTIVFVRGSVIQVAQSLGVTFARVGRQERDSSQKSEYTSAVTAPSLPADLADCVLGIDGLQPDARLRHVRAKLRPDDAVNGSLFVTPNDVAAAHHTSSAWTGKGQVIAIVDDAAATSSDLTSFWSTVGVTQSVANLSVINVAGGANSTADATETALDVEWAGALAPDARIRLYLAANPLNCLTQIQNDLPANPTLSVVSISFSAPEASQSKAAIQNLAQTMAQLAASGITVFCSSGDGGSNPNSNTGSYSATNALSAEYPASDPSATGVGGTNQTYTSSFVLTGETVWDQRTNQKTPAATGGGISTVFPAPSWQTGATGRAQRSVPDVSAIAAATENGNALGAYVFVGGSSQAAIGTSLSAPVWAAFCAQLNQARASVGLGRAGLLGPLVYPLIGTSAFTDITSGSNGAYNASAGYDLCTGLGSPNVTNLIVALGGLAPPAITTQPQAVTVNAGSLFSFSVVASGGGTLSYQWSLNGNAIAGANGSSYVKGVATSADAGAYAVLVSNASGSVTSSSATLTVNAAAAAAAPASSGGGGGGAPSAWFYGALALAVACRQATRRSATE